MSEDINNELIHIVYRFACRALSDPHRLYCTRTNDALVVRQQDRVIVSIHDMCCGQEEYSLQHGQGRSIDLICVNDGAVMKIPLYEVDGTPVSTFHEVRLRLPQPVETAVAHDGVLMIVMRNGSDKGYKLVEVRASDYTSDSVTIRTYSGTLPESAIDILRLSLNNIPNVSMLMDDDSSL